MGTGEQPATYENVLPLVESTRSDDGVTFEYVFRCPETGFKATGAATLPEVSPPPAKGPGPMDAMTGELGASAARDRIARRIPGGELVADLAEGAFGWRRGKRSQDRAVAEGKARSVAVEQQLVLDAFATVSDQFRWDADGARWVKA